MKIADNNIILLPHNPLGSKVNYFWQRWLDELSKILVVVYSRIGFWRSDFLLWGNHIDWRCWSWWQYPGIKEKFLKGWSGFSWSTITFYYPMSPPFIFLLAHFQCFFLGFRVWNCQLLLTQKLGTQRYFNVHLTLNNVKQRWMLAGNVRIMQDFILVTFQFWD